MTKENAMEAYKQGRVRYLYTLESSEAAKHFVDVGVLLNVINAENVDQDQCFITFDGSNFGLYEIVKD